MKLFELFATQNQEWVVTQAAKLTPKKDQEIQIIGYSQAWREIKSLVPNEPSGMTILLHLEETDDVPPRPVVRVSGIQDGEDARYALELTDWADWLAMDVETTPELKISDEQKLVHIIYEMTWSGFSRQAITSKAEDVRQDIVRITGQDGTAAAFGGPPGFGIPGR